MKVWPHYEAETAHGRCSVFGTSASKAVDSFIHICFHLSMIHLSLTVSRLPHPVCLLRHIDGKVLPSPSRSSSLLTVHPQQRKLDENLIHLLSGEREISK